ncbi:flagellar calcium-binding protein [Angomonas deanei]|nr:flagellar calcium-binding protein [Angomonas deanei]|eukprot:EPY29866.1 flagellar calcium-binding protein [Angomonas deanei]
MGCTSSKSTSAKKDKSAAERKVAWERIKQRLPRGKNQQDKDRRIALFKEFDKNGTGKLSFDEVYAGCKDVLKLDEFTNRLRDIVKRAFNKAKDAGNKAEGAGSEDFVEFLEFRLMLCYIYDFFELTVMFDEIDASGNGLIDLKELKEAAPKIREWGVGIDDPEAVFKKIDDNGSGSITFDEFAQWATAAKLDADGDPDNTA